MVSWNGSRFVPPLPPNPLLASMLKLGFIATAVLALAPVIFAAEVPVDEGRHLPRVKAIPPTLEEVNLREAAQDDLRHLGRNGHTFTAKQPGTLPSDFSPWWIRGQRNTLGESDRSEGISLEGLYVR